MSADFKYLEIYNRYKDLILSGKMKSGTRLPSIRSCAEENSVSRTTVQTAYDCLTADGCIIAKPQSGYFAADFALSRTAGTVRTSTAEIKPKYDLASERADSDSFDFSLWQRYIKSALRNAERMTTYGEPQGEYDLRCAVCDYLQNSRSAVCSPESIVLGAGSQSLLSLIMPLLRDRRTVHFTNSGFSQGKTVFTDNGFTLTERNDADIFYVTPSRLSRKGDVMTPKDRFSFAKAMRDNHSMIIEDDYGSELSAPIRPTPCIQGICGGENVIYISTFSKLLVPSIRISFMVLPPDILEKYLERRSFYNQTASKIEQIALCKFIQDGHLNSQIRKIRRAYAEKSDNVKHMICDILGSLASVYSEDDGRYLRLTLKTDMSAKSVAAAAKAKSLLISPIADSDTASFIISYYGVPDSELKTAFEILKDIIFAGEK